MKTAAFACPSCNGVLRKTLGEDRKPRFYCTECDWGSEHRQRLVEISRANRPDPDSWAAVEPARGWRLVGLWIASLTMILFPYLLVLLQDDKHVDPDYKARFASSYWLFVSVYLFICLLWSEWLFRLLKRSEWLFVVLAAIERNSVSFYEELYNWINRDRNAEPEGGSRIVGVLLIPGKTVLYTLYSTVKLVV